MSRTVAIQRRRRASERGSTLVECALVMFLLLVMIIGILDCGQFLFFHQTLVERARLAARWGGIHPYSAESIQNMVLYGSPNAPGAAVGDSRPDGLFGLAPANVIVDQPAGGAYETRVRVILRGYQFPMFSPLIARSATGQDIVITAPYEFTAPPS